MPEALNFLGRKLFFLYPSVVTQNRIITELAQQEIEAYQVKDHVKLKRLLKKYPNAIVFANIYEGMTEKEWEAWIRGVMTDPATKDVDIGIICSGEDETLKRKYLGQVGIKCGYIILKSDLSAAMKELFDILKAADAKGRRKYIRAVTGKEPNAKVNLPVNGTFVNGAIHDISVVGFSCSFAEEQELAKNTLFQDIQIKLQTTILKAEGIVFGSRLDNGSKVYVILFTQRMDPDTKVRIRKYIQSVQQAKIDAELKS